MKFKGVKKKEAIEILVKQFNVMTTHVFVPPQLIVERRNDILLLLLLKATVTT